MGFIFNRDPDCSILPLHRIMSAPEPSSSSSEASLPAEAVERIVSHMNEDHADAVLRYARYFGQSLAAESARLVDLDTRAMRIAVDFPDAPSRRISVAFREPLTSADDAHRVMVAMAKEARRREARHRAMETAREFAENFRTVMLGTIDAEGNPDVSVCPAVWFPEEAAFYTYVSDLSVHTANLRASGRASLMIIEDESAASQLLARRRLTFPVSAAFIDREEDGFSRPMEALKEKFGPVMNHLEAMTDFHLIRLAPGRGRLVNGFAQAYDVEGDNWEALGHVGDQGHTRKSGGKRQ
mgnify:FL=1